MSHSLTKIWIHAIFGLKYKKYLISKEIFPEMVKHIEGKLRDLDCKTRVINGTSDHLHILFLLSPKKSVSDIMKLVKGETSRWMNQQELITNKFAWQIGFGAFSISESGVKVLQNYIRNQKEHHKKMTFEEEYKFFKRHHGLL